MRKWMIVPFVMIGVLVCGCSDAGSGGGQIMDGDGMFQIFQYKQISQDETREMMEKDDGHVIVDVRRQDDYAVNSQKGRHKHSAGWKRGDSLWQD